MRRRIFLPVFIFLSNFIFGQTAKYSNEFLSIGVGARSLGMANSTIAHVNDVTSGYWNPAGLTLMQTDFDAALMHAEYFAGIAKYDYLGGAMALDTNSYLGATIIRFGVDDIPNTTDLIDKDGNIDYGRISRFSAADYAFLLSYARKTNIPNLSYGANVKVIYRNIGKFAQAWGFGLDLGFQYQYKKWKFGALARDITSTFNAWSFNEDELIVEVQDSVFNFAPDNSLEITLPRLILGASRDFKIYNKFMLLAEIDLDFTFDGQRHVLIEGDPVSIDPHAGIEIHYNNLAFIRFGVGNFQRIKDFTGTNMTFQPNFGIGIQFKGISIDYALTDIGDQSIALYSNVFSLRYSFDRKSE
ncbi:MAG TPA: PorV/PorQ family protein [Bacteroidales bacterium]|nr:PorV/PorQ family protein [Bacteroidales bacterium]